MLAANRSGGASIEMLNTAWHTASRQYENRSRARAASVDQMFTCALANPADSFEPRFALSANLLALPPKIARIGQCRCPSMFTFFAMRQDGQALARHWPRHGIHFCARS